MGVVSLPAAKSSIYDGRADRRVLCTAEFPSNMAVYTRARHERVRTGVTRGGHADYAEPKYFGSRETAGIKRRKQKYLQVRCAPLKKNLN